MGANFSLLEKEKKREVWNEAEIIRIEVEPTTGQIWHK